MNEEKTRSPSWFFRIAIVSALALCVNSCATTSLEGAVPKLEIFYVFDPFGGAPSISAVRFFGDGDVELSSVGGDTRSRRLGESDLGKTRGVLKDPRFWELLGKSAIQVPAGNKTHVSFIAIATPESRVENALPPLQLEVEEIPNELRAFLAVLEESVQSTFPRTDLRPRIAR